jgi:hypothetical protein
VKVVKSRAATGTVKAVNKASSWGARLPPLFRVAPPPPRCGPPCTECVNRSPPGGGYTGA